MNKLTRTKVAIVKVEDGKVEQAVREAISLLGGITQFTTDAEEVLLKPNLLSAPEDKSTRDKIRTDPRILEALSNILLENNQRVLIADNSGVGHPGGTRVALKNSDYLKLGEKDDRIAVRPLGKNGLVVSEINGKNLKTANIAKDVITAAVIINVPKMKTHGLTLYTGAIKNLFGTVCGSDKSRIHSAFPTISSFSQSLVDIYAFEKEKITLNIMDAIIAVEGMGPGASGTPVEMNLILASADVVALDAVAFRLMGHDPKKVPATRLAAEQGLGIMDLNKIEILGEKIEQHKKKFRLPKTAILARIPFSRFAHFFMIHIPVYQTGCIGCKACERACPQSVITIEKTEEGSPHPEIDYSGCISCFTCVEVCPEACYTTRSKNLWKVWLTLAIVVLLGALVAILVLLL